MDGPSRDTLADSLLVIDPKLFGMVAEVASYFERTLALICEMTDPTPPSDLVGHELANGAGKIHVYFPLRDYSQLTFVITCNDTTALACIVAGLGYNDFIDVIGATFPAQDKAEIIVETDADKLSSSSLAEVFNEIVSNMS